MAMFNQTRRPIGKILVDAGFLSSSQLELALEEQKRTNELLGQVLVRMGVLDPADIRVALSIQEHLSKQDAVRITAGVRQKLGALLVQAGRITDAQLDDALAVQKRTGEKLGEVFLRLGLLTAQQLDGLLDFQERQGAAAGSPGPLRLGELLISAGHISREQLDDALLKQTRSGKKLGEVLVEEGYAQLHQIKHGVRLQQMLLTAVLISLLSACGSGGNTAETGSGIPATSSTTQEQVQNNYLVTTADDYGLLKPNFYYSTDNSAFWSIQSAVASDVYDPNFRYVIRIDIQKGANGTMPDISGKVFSIEDNGQYEKFPGTFFVFNGELSVSKKVEQGTISFTPDSTAANAVQGSFDITFIDYDSAIIPPPQYHLKGMFSFKIGTFGPANTLPVAVAP